MRSIVSELDFQIDSAHKVESLITSLRNKLEQSFEPIWTLPPEVMSEIFDWVLRNSSKMRSHVDTSRRAAARSRLMGVCRSWRRIVVGQPSLWTAVEFNLPHYTIAASRTARAGALPPAMTIKVDLKHPEEETILGDLLALPNDLWRNRVADLTWMGTCYNLCAYLTQSLLKAGKLPMLQALRIIPSSPETQDLSMCKCDERALEMEHVNHSNISFDRGNVSSSMQSIELNGVSIAIPGDSLHPNFTNLRYLSLQEPYFLTWKGVVELLRHVPRLEILDLYDVSSQNHVPREIVRGAEPFVLPYLRVLRIEEVLVDLLGMILASISCPKISKWKFSLNTIAPEDYEILVQTELDRWEDASSGLASMVS